MACSDGGGDGGGLDRLLLLMLCSWLLLLVGLLLSVLLLLRPLAANLEGSFFGRGFWHEDDGVVVTFSEKKS